MSNNDNDNGTDNGRARAVRRPLRWAGAFVVLGLLVEAGTLFWAHPTAFIFFAIFGGGLVLLGIALYLWTVLRSVELLGA